MRHLTRLALLSILIVASLTAACGDSTDSNTAQQAAAPGSLVTSTPEPAGANCAQGGLAVQSGVDSNRNNVLDADEVTSTSYICNGSNGEDGQDGGACDVERDDAAGTTTVTCPGSDPVVIQDGADGADGQPCDVERDDAAGTTTVTCPGSDPVVIQDGTDGQPCDVARDDDAGTTTVTCPGSDPVVIQDGQDAPDGGACDVERDDAAGTTTITCPNSDPVVIQDGVDGQSCDVERDDDAGTTTVTCPGSDPVVIQDGTDGVDGQPCDVERDDDAGTTTVTCPNADPVIIQDPVISLGEPEFSVENNTFFDLELLLEGDSGDILLSINGDDVTIDSAGPATQIAQLYVASYTDITLNDLARAEFGTNQAIIPADPQEAGDPVVFVRTEEGNLFKVGNIQALENNRVGFDLAPLPFDLPTQRFSAGETFIDLETGRSDLNNFENNDVDFIVEQQNPLRVSIAPGINARILRVPLPFASVDETHADLAVFTNDLTPLYSTNPNQPHSTALVWTSQGNVFKIGRVVRVGEGSYAVEVERIRLDLPEQRFLGDEPFYDLETGRSDLDNFNNNDIAFNVENNGSLEVSVEAFARTGITRVPLPFASVNGSHVNFAALENRGFVPLFSNDPNQPHTTAIVRTEQNNFFKIGDVVALPDGQYAIEIEPLQVDIPDFLFEDNAPLDITTMSTDNLDGTEGVLSFNTFEGRIDGVSLDPNHLVATIPQRLEGLVDASILASLTFENNLQDDPQNEGPFFTSFILRTVLDRFLYFTNVRAYTHGERTLIGFDVRTLDVPLQSHEVFFEQGFDLENFTQNTPGDDVIFSPSAFGMPPRLSSLNPDVTFARITNVSYDFVDLNTVGQNANNFSPNDVSLSRDPNAFPAETSDPVILIAIENVAVFKLRPGIATSTQTYTFTLDVLFID